MRHTFSARGIRFAGDRRFISLTHRFKTKFEKPKKFKRFKMSLSKFSERYNNSRTIDHVMQDFYNKLEANTWTSKEMRRILEDLRDYNEAPPRIKQIFEELLEFFAPGDNMVSENLSVRFILEARTREERKFYILQNSNEIVHQDTYNLFIFILPEDVQVRVLRGVDDIEAVNRKALFIQHLIEAKESYALRRVRAACTEGIFFVSLFQIIFFFRNKNIFKEFVFANEQISKDETLHRDQNCEAARRELTVAETPEVIAIIEEAVAIEVGHLEHILRTPVYGKEEDIKAGLTVENLTIFVKMLADQILIRCGLRAHYKCHIDLPWSKGMGDSRKQNFYEGTVGNYKMFSVKDANNKVSEDAYTNPVKVLKEAF